MRTVHITEVKIKHYRATYSSLVNKMFIIWQKQEQFNVSFSCAALTQILIANGDEPNLILLKFAVPLCFFLSSALWHLGN